MTTPWLLSVARALFYFYTKLVLTVCTSQLSKRKELPILGGSFLFRGKDEIGDVI